MIDTSQSWESHSALTDTPFPASDMISVLKGHWLLPGERMIGRALVERGDQIPLWRSLGIDQAKDHGSLGLGVVYPFK